MSSSIFDQYYAERFDRLYADKDYESECELLEQVFQRYGRARVRTILDLGCGTGNYSIRLARRGYAVHGVDISEHMLACAARKVKGENSVPSAVFSREDVRTLNLGTKFDAAIMMFAVLDYQLTDSEVLATFRSVHRHLEPGGLFVFDVWYGPAVLAIRPEDRIKEVPIDGGKLIRSASSSLDIDRHQVEVCYRLDTWSGGRVVASADECHVMRFFFPDELTSFLDQCGLRQQSLTAFPSLDAPADETTWNVIVIGRAA